MYHPTECRLCEIRHRCSVHPHQAISLTHARLFSCTSCHHTHREATFLSYTAETGRAEPLRLQLSSSNVGLLVITVCGVTFQRCEVDAQT